MAEQAQPADDAEAVVYVIYQGTPADRFDRGYYLERHLPLVMHAWGRHGLERLTAFFPALEAPGTVAVCECRFRDEASIERSFNSPECEAVMADITRYTDLRSIQLRARPLR
ncbi:EthD family reductase [Sphingobium sp. Sx8-8]|uniref:EthD family reductase n=1 Tax=Sphingobium sp. Sx8-8 TaxID=2933617 RepID=UPI001F596595|nr:EthD family reductase [Sphingobium sp. Sx8-8]